MNKLKLRNWMLVLIYLYEKDGGVKIRDVARGCKFDRSMITILCNLLKENGLIYKHRHGKSVSVVLTNRGATIGERLVYIKNKLVEVENE